MLQEGDIVNVRSAHMPQYNRNNAVIESVSTNTYGRSYYRIRGIPTVVFVEESIHPAEEPKLTNEAILTMFLKKHRKYTAFIRNVKHHAHHPFDRVEMAVMNAISAPFEWINTKEGNNSWGIVNVKWREMCQELNIEGQIDVRKL